MAGGKGGSGAGGGGALASFPQLQPPIENKAKNSGGTKDRNKNLAVRSWSLAPWWVGNSRKGGTQINSLRGEWEDVVERS